MSGLDAEINDTKEANERSACYIPSSMRIVIIVIIIVAIIVIVVMTMRQTGELLMWGG